MNPAASRGGERFAQVGIIVQLLAVIRCLGEFFRLKYVGQGAFRAESVEPFILGAGVAATFCVLSLLLYFSGRWRGSIVTTIVCVATLLVLKFTLIG